MLWHWIRGLWAGWVGQPWPWSGPRIEAPGAQLCGGGEACAGVPVVAGGGGGALQEYRRTWDGQLTAFPRLSGSHSDLGLRTLLPEGLTRDSQVRVG